LTRSKKPREELRCEQRKSAAEDDARDLSLGACLTEHEKQSADDDRDQRQGPRAVL
jgi:hypothetical protein